VALRGASAAPPASAHGQVHQLCPVIRDTPRPDDSVAEDLVVSLAWFPSGEYEDAIRRWPSLAEDWADVPHSDYCARLDGNIKWMRSNGMPIRAVAPIIVEDYVAWCAEHDEDPEEARAAYAVDLMTQGEAIAWPPGRNERCWCGSGRKYKKCCGPASPRPMHEPSLSPD
jgi:hypothetical protein